MSLLILSFMGAHALLKMACQFRSRHGAIEADGYEHKLYCRSGVCRNVNARIEAYARPSKRYYPGKIPPKVVWYMPLMLYSWLKMGISIVYMAKRWPFQKVDTSLSSAHFKISQWWAKLPSTYRQIWYHTGILILPGSVVTFCKSPNMMCYMIQSVT